MNQTEEDVIYVDYSKYKLHSRNFRMSHESEMSFRDRVSRICNSVIAANYPDRATSREIKVPGSKEVNQINIYLQSKS